MSDELKQIARLRLPNGQTVHPDVVSGLTELPGWQGPQSAHRN